MAASKRQNMYDGLPIISKYNGKELKHQSLGWLKFSDLKIIYIYLMKIGEETYIGSTAKPHFRMNGHLCAMKGGRAFPRMQEAFNKHMSFTAYLLFCVDCEDDEILGKLMEQYFINLLRPTLNVNNALSQKDVYYTMASHAWKPIDVREECIVKNWREREYNKSIPCPCCGAELKLVKL